MRQLGETALYGDCYNFDLYHSTRMNSFNTRYTHIDSNTDSSNSNSNRSRNKTRVIVRSRKSINNSTSDTDRTCNHKSN